MNTFLDLTAAQLRHIIHLKERIEYLQGLLASLRGAAVPTSPTKKKVGTRTTSLGTPVKKVPPTNVKPPVAKKKDDVRSGQGKLAATMKAGRLAKKKSAQEKSCE